MSGNRYIMDKPTNKRNNYDESDLKPLKGLVDLAQYYRRNTIIILHDSPIFFKYIYPAKNKII